MNRDLALAELQRARIALDACEAALRSADVASPAPIDAYADGGAPTPEMVGDPRRSIGLSNPPGFFDALRGTLWPRLTPEIVSGIEATLKVAAGVLPIGWAAYALATEYHETAYTMQAIKERGSNAYLDKYDTGPLAARLGNTPEDDDDGIRLAGRGKVQITGADNYRRATTKLRDLGVIGLDVDLFANPDLALQPDIAAAILVYGMRDGWFTGKRLNDYINNEPTILQFTSARRIVNGTDRAADIAGYAMKFLKALQLGGWQ